MKNSLWRRIKRAQTQAGIYPDIAIQNINWKEARHYRISITVGDTHANDTGRSHLFRDYDMIAAGAVTRRRGETFYILDLRKWMSELAQKAIVACDPAPKLAGADIRSRQDLVAYKGAQDFRNADFADFLVSHHVQAIMWPDSRKILHDLIDETLHQHVANAIGGRRRIIVDAETHQRGRTACPLQAARRLNQ